MRKAGDVVYTDVDNRGEGIVEFATREDMEKAVDRLDDTEFKNPYDSTYIRVKFANKETRHDSRDDRGRHSRSRSRERSSERKSSRKSARDSDSDEDDGRRSRKRDEEDDDEKDSDEPRRGRVDTKEATEDD